MLQKERINPVRYARISLREDAPGRTHHAIIFSEVPSDKKLTPASRFGKYLKFLTWTPTGHGWVSNWDVVGPDNVATHTLGEEILGTSEAALLIPRSLWIWFIPERFMSQKAKMNLFFLEVGA